jgi:hypothetical protein
VTELYKQRDTHQSWKETALPTLELTHINSTPGSSQFNNKFRETIDDNRQAPRSTAAFVEKLIAKIRPGDPRDVIRRST